MSDDRLPTAQFKEIADLKTPATKSSSTKEECKGWTLGAVDDTPEAVQGKDCSS